MSRRAQPGLGLHRFATFVASCTFALLIAGGLVTSNDAGLAVPDWPLSYGSFFPPMVGNILYEHGHRLIASFVGFLTMILAVWLGLREPRRWVRRLGVLALAAVIAQGVLGGLTVLLLLPPLVSVAHATLAQLFFCLTVSLAVFTSPGWKTATPAKPDTSMPSLPDLALVTLFVIFVQLILGAAYRHSVIGIAPHLVGAAAVTFFVVRTVRRAREHAVGLAAVRSTANGLGGLLALQVSLGVAAWWSRLATADASQPLPLVVTLTVAHLATGALLLAAALVLALQAHRLLATPGRAAEYGDVDEKVAA